VTVSAMCGERLPWCSAAKLQALHRFASQSPRVACRFGGVRLARMSPPLFQRKPVDRMHVATAQASLQ